jgi:hypothetical protein
MVAQIDEGHAPMVAAAMDPAGNLDGLANMFGAKGATSVCTKG